MSTQVHDGGELGTPAAPDGGGRWLAPGVPILAGTVAVVSILTGALMAAVAVAGHAFTPWVSAGPLSPGLVGAAMLGVSPGLLLVGRATRWEEVRTLMLPTAVVLLGLLTVSLVNGGRLYLVHGGSIVLVLFSLGWVGVLALLALGALICLLLQYLTPVTPVRERTVPIPGWAKPFLALLGSSWFGIGAGLLGVPGFWGALLPWRVDRADAQALGVWALALGVGVLGGLVEDDLARLRPALLSLPGVAVVAGVLLGSRAGEVHWASGPGVSLIAMLAGLLASGGIGYRLLSRRTTGPNAQAGEASPGGPAEPARPDGPVGSARSNGPVESARPDGPVESARPNGPVESARPDGPVESARPNGPVGPARPGGPVGAPGGNG